MPCKSSAQCKKCRRTSYMTEDEFEESVQVGCQHCASPEEDTFKPEYIPNLNKWRIAYFRRRAYWFLGERISTIKEYVRQSISNVDGCGNDAILPLEFDRRKEAMDYIWINLM